MHVRSASLAISWRALTICLTLATWPAAAAAADGAVISLGSVQLTAPADWEKRQPKSTIVNYEFAAPAAEGESAGGRFTVMAAGGGVKANIDRWFGQFKQPDGSPTRDKAKVEKRTINEYEVHIADISGTFEDKPGPMAPGVLREKYRMLGAIVVTPQAEFYLKLTGPENTIARHRKAFVAMLETLTAK